MSQQDIWDSEDAEIRQAFAEKDAEIAKQSETIARLQAEYLKLDEKLEQALRKNENQATLITELADELQLHNIDRLQDDLLQRAREGML